MLSSRVQSLATKHTPRREQEETHVTSGVECRLNTSNQIRHLFVVHDKVSDIIHFKVRNQIINRVGDGFYRLWLTDGNFVQMFANEQNAQNRHEADRCVRRNRSKDCRCNFLSVNCLSSVRPYPSGVRRSEGERSEPSAAEPRRGKDASRAKNWSRVGHIGFLLGCRKHIQHQTYTWLTTPILNS